MSPTASPVPSSVPSSLSSVPSSLLSSVPSPLPSPLPSTFSLPSSAPSSLPSSVPSVPSSAEDSRRREILGRLNAKSAYHISQQVGTPGYELFLGHKWENGPGHPVDEPFGEVLERFARANVCVRRWADRIKAVNDAFTGPPASSTGAQSSQTPLYPSSSPSSPSLKVDIDPSLAPDFQRHLSILSMKIPKRKFAEVEEELEEGEIREEAAPKLRKLGEDLTNARASAAASSSSPTPTLPFASRPRTAADTAASSSSGSSHRTVKPAKTANSSSSSRPDVKENRPIRPLPSRTQVPLPPKPSPPSKLVGVMASEEISLATSRIITMGDILHALSPHYVFPDDMAWTGVPLDTDPNVSEEELDEYCAHVRKISATLFKALEDEEKLDVEIEVFKNLPSIINHETVPHLPEGYIEKFKKLPIYCWSQAEWPEKNHRQKTFMILNSLVHLNKVRIGERESIFAPIKLDGPKVSKAEDAA